jgi:hypothetical protein
MTRFISFREASICLCDFQAIDQWIEQGFSKEEEIQLGRSIFWRRATPSKNMRIISLKMLLSCPFSEIRFSLNRHRETG